MRRRQTLGILAVAFAALIAVSAAHAGTEGDRPRPGREEVRKAIRDSLAWVDANLSKLPDASGTPRKPFTFAVAGLTYLMAEGVPGVKVRRSAVPEIESFLVRFVEGVAKRVADPSQLPPRHGLFSSDNLIQYTWPLAQAGIFFSELELRGRLRPESRNSLRTIVRLLEEAQQGNGGWGHGRIRPDSATPPARPRGGLPEFPVAGGGYPSTLLAASNCAATALGIIEATLGRGTVKGLDRARLYYRKARLPNGNFPYDPSQRSSGRALTGVSRTGGALLAMYFLGIPPSDADVRGSLAFLRKHLDYLSEGHGSATLNLMHSALALKLLDDLDFARFRAEYFPRILAAQSPDGDLACVCERKAFGTSCDGPRAGMPDVFAQTGKVYVTALNAFVLLLDEGRLKILGKKPVPAPPRSTSTERPRRGK